jgi:SNF2 family DNA or RNA helicase
LETIAERLRAAYGRDAVVEFHGGVAENERAGNTERFENDRKCRFIVANAVVGGMGQTWVAATKTIYYSNTFSYEDRMQSEDRNHRRGQHNAVTYYDIVMSVKADTMILKALRKKGDVATEFRDGVRSMNFSASSAIDD